MAFPWGAAIATGVPIIYSQLTKDRSAAERPWLDPAHPDYMRLREKAGLPGAAADIGRRPAVGDLSEAAAAQTEAMRTAINRQLVEALGRMEIGAAQAGWYRSGALGEKRVELEEAGMRDIAEATARTSLERMGMERGFQLQEAQLRILKEQEDARRLSSIIQGIPGMLRLLYDVGKGKGWMPEWLGGGGEKLRPAISSSESPPGTYDPETGYTPFEGG